MPRMTGGDAIVDGLLRHGIDTIFGLPGVQTYGLFDALARNTNRLRVINARHEQTTAYMALGYACSTGRPAANHWFSWKHNSRRNQRRSCRSSVSAAKGRNIGRVNRSDKIERRHCRYCKRL